MCFRIPKKIVTLTNQSAQLETGETVDISGLTDCQIGDYVLTTGPVAVEKVTAAAAKEMREIINQTKL